MEALPPLVTKHSCSGDRRFVARSRAGIQGGSAGSAPCAGEASRGLSCHVWPEEGAGSVDVRTSPHCAPHTCSKRPFPGGALWVGHHSGGNVSRRELTGAAWPHRALGDRMEAAGPPGGKGCRCPPLLSPFQWTDLPSWWRDQAAEGMLTLCRLHQPIYPPGSQEVSGVSHGRCRTCAQTHRCVFTPFGAR